MSHDDQNIKDPIHDHPRQMPFFLAAVKADG